MDLRPLRGVEAHVCDFGRGLLAVVVVIVEGRWDDQGSQ